MAHFKVPQLNAVILLLAVTSASSAQDQSRWSRQISSYTADISDWVPLSGPVEKEPPLPPVKRQAFAEPRILTEPFPGVSRPTGFDSFPSRAYYNSPSNRQLYLQSVPSVPSAPQNYLTEQGFGQSIRFGLQQPNFPLSQGFISPQFGYENIPQMKQRPQAIPSSPVKFENFAKTTSQLSMIKPEQQSSPKVEREEVQLLYVPLESLNRGQFNFRSPLTSSQMMNIDLYSPGAQRPHKQAPELQKPIPKHVDNLSNYFTDFNTQLKDIDQVPKFSTLASPFPTAPPTTPKPKKLKPHQPPLAIFLTEEASGNNQIKVRDVLNSLKHASSVPVLDSVNPLNAPKVFIGPSSLQPLDRYVKFELPYLSNIENSDKKLRQLPFFVAPLSYNTPQGFAKIPFPSPHVGSVVINSQIRDSTPQGPSTENVQPNYYTGVYRQEQKPITHKPTVSFYSTAAPPPKVNNNQQNYQSNYYSFEPQSVSTFKPINEPQVAPIKPGNYFLNNPGAQYNFATQNSYPVQEPVKPYMAPTKETTTTHRTTVTTTTKPPSTYPSQLLETHNPYSINQAFHFSTPLAYHTYLEENKEPAATSGTVENPTPVPPKPSTTTTKVEEVVTEKTYQQQTSPNYVQSYSPEIHYASEGQSQRYPTYDSNEYTTKTETAESYNPVKNDNIAEVSPPQYTESQDTQAPVVNENITQDGKVSTVNENDNQQRYDYTQFETGYDEEIKTSTTSTTTTTKRPVKTRNRTRYTTTPRSESSEYSTRAVTRRPLRERRPLPTRRYEPNKITTEKPTRKPIDYSSGESTTKSTRTRTRGRIQYRPNESDEQEKRKTHGKKDQDLAYQRDVLHQNYPVTIQERMSTVDIEAMTEPSLKIPSTKNEEYVTENLDTENAYTNEKTHSVRPFNFESNSEEDIPVFPLKTTSAQTETSYEPELFNEEFNQSKSSISPSELYEETVTESYAKQTTVPKEETVYASESVTLSDPSGSRYFINSEYSRHETTTSEPEVTTVVSQEEQEENVVQTTPSYNRVRVRPGVIRQYQQQASSESPRVKTERRRPVTYRPAFDKRRTTMRIDEIEADLKTKQVHGRHESDYKHPVYKPEPTTEATSTQEVTTKRGQIRRRRPSYSYTTSTTEGSDRAVTSRNKYEVKNRFRGRRPATEKPTEKPEVQIDTSSTTRTLYTRYSPRPRLSERYNKKPEPEKSEDQDSNYSYNRPKYAEPESDIWSDKISTDSFKPYNPNDIVDDQKFATTERRSDRGDLDIITASNEFEDILFSVTPATNNRNNKKIPDIPPTLEALVEQSKVTKSDTGDSMSTFESMLEEVMKSLEEQDEDEYSSNEESSTNHRRGFWKKVKVRPVSTESIEVAESQYYPNTVNRLGQPLRQSHEKSNFEKPRIDVTTYKPTFQFIKDIFSSEDQEAQSNVEYKDIAKIASKTEKNEENPTTVADEEIRTDKYTSSGEADLGTGSPGTIVDDMINTSTEPTTVKEENISKVESFSFMDYLFGVTSEDKSDVTAKNKTKAEIEITTEMNTKMTESPTESSYIPDEITEASEVIDNVERVETTSKVTEAPREETTKSVYMNVNVMSTSMSTEVSHETEICFRGKCIKTSKDIL
ncbi:hypothetical protein OBRU01_16349 [Operophtera brumata]|uniref:Uncharacterized protein n=1 Tax=Operophtera brumata TaxID=104452 RepID=A0A0L7L3D1_OPEBR|nr:hypothetical protein OBRU01_16349 [Operophtera brumata]